MALPRARSATVEPMSQGDGPVDKRFSLARWSARKREAARAGATREPVTTPAVAPATATPTPTRLTPADAAAATGVPRETQPLPDVASLTFDSDFTAFMARDVDADVRRAALRKLLRDPRFNVMDGLDVYIDDYTRADPIPPEMLAQLAHTAALFASTAATAPADADGGASGVPDAAPSLPPETARAPQPGVAGMGETAGIHVAHGASPGEPATAGTAATTVARAANAAAPHASDPER